MATAAPSAPVSLTGIRDRLREQQQTVQRQIELDRAAIKDNEKRHQQLKTDVGALDRAADDLEAARTEADKASADAAKTLGELLPRLKATLDKGVEEALTRGFDTLRREIDEAEQAVHTARTRLASLEGEQAVLQRENDAAEAAFTGRLTELKQLPADTRTLIGRLRTLQGNLRTAADAGKVRQAYVVALDLRATTEELDRRRTPAHEQTLVTQFEEAKRQVEGQRHKLAEGRAAIVAQEGVLQGANNTLARHRAEREKRLKALWDDELAQPPGPPPIPDKAQSS